MRMQLVSFVLLIMLYLILDFGTLRVHVNKNLIIIIHFILNILPLIFIIIIALVAIVIVITIIIIIVD
jgi:hypothetical protein